MNRAVLHPGMTGPPFVLPFNNFLLQHYYYNSVSENAFDNDFDGSKGLLDLTFKGIKK